MTDADISVNGDVHEDVRASEAAATTRRSGRQRKQTKFLAEDEDFAPTVRNKAPSNAKQANGSPAKPVSRRTVQRRAAAAAAAASAAVKDGIPDNILEEAIAPLCPEERAEWEGWVELESEPAFFNVILKDLGVRDVKVQEVFSLDPDSLAFLPSPVYGLIFLYKYLDAHGGGLEEQDVDSSDVWFANQTIDNACATLAMMNILMNADSDPAVDLGDLLRTFKHKTTNLSPPLRGWELGRERSLRAVHNGVARRLDFLNADLALQHEVDEHELAQRRNKAKHRYAASRRSKRDQTTSYHFIAYVPIDGKVWQLDGLEKVPFCIGEYVGDWVPVVAPLIQTRMMMNESDQAFSLLAMCRSPLLGLRDQIADNMAEALHLHQATAGNPEHGPATRYTILEDENGNLSLVDAETPQPASLFGLDRQTILSRKPSGDFTSRVGEFRTHEDWEGLIDMRTEVETEGRRLRAEYLAEVISLDDDVARVRGRRTDMTPVIHLWLKKLAEKGVLQELIEEHKR